MQRTTPLDAFNAVARFTQGALSVPIQEATERNVNRINVDTKSNSLVLDDWMSKNSFKGGRNDVEDSAAFEKYMQDAIKKINEQYAITG